MRPESEFSHEIMWIYPRLSTASVFQGMNLLKFGF